MRFGVATAQRGWVEADRVINTWPLHRLRRFLAKGRDYSRPPSRRRQFDWHCGAGAASP
ncbi:hypothetical protein AB0L63_29870 [Nocardia sp. NPDC051990]|uniref:hypothetical protein n=1 Tax=Nocardia sp. NPDC051990 TaxID=3155285 RepID=UPI00341B3A69